MTRSLPRSLPRSLALVATISGAGACDALTDDEYRGEALLSLHGNVENRRQVAPSNVNIYLQWLTPRAGNVVQQLEVMATFPATFKLDVFQAPPVGEIVQTPFGFAADRLAVGHIVAATADASFQHAVGLPTTQQGDGILGVDPRHMIYYVPDGLDEGTLGSLVLHGAVAPGFHVADVKCLGPAKKAEIEACLAKYHADGGVNEFEPVMRACGLSSPLHPWLQIAKDDLQTELTVELMDDFESYQPDPADCI